MTFFAGAAAIALEDASDIAGPLSQKKFSRDSEYEADLLGVEYTYAAGYDPQALLVALEKLHALELQRAATLAKIPGYHLASRIPFHAKLAHSFASYPLTEERIERLQSEIATYLPSRDDYIMDTNDFEEVKAILMSSQMPTLRRHHSEGDDKGPVLRRTTTTDSDSDVPAPAPVAKIARQVSAPATFVSTNP
jgi:predicted Zn-dependent protease